jgi:hypothetical protein
VNTRVFPAHWPGTLGLPKGAAAGLLKWGVHVHVHMPRQFCDNAVVRAPQRPTLQMCQIILKSYAG